jgi:CheY-like chemotaxis protein
MTPSSERAETGKPADPDGAASRPNAAQERANDAHAAEPAAELAALKARCAELERQNELLGRSNAQLERERDGYRQRYDTLPVSCLTLEPDGGVVEGNATFAALLGLDATPTGGVNLAAVIAAPQHVERFRDHLAAVFRAPGLHCCELWLRKPDGGVTRVRLESTAVTTTASALHGGVVAGTAPALRGGTALHGSERGAARLCRSVIAEVTMAPAATSGGGDRFAPVTSLNDTAPVLRGGASAPPSPASVRPFSSSSGEAAASTAAPAPSAPLATVLVVEDESLVRKAVQHYLTTAGYRVLTAVDREGALECCEQHDGAIDLILTDLSLPNGATGPEIVEQIRSRRPKAGVLYMTACPADMLARRGFALAAGATLEKPFSKEKLLARVVKELAAAARDDA